MEREPGFYWVRMKGYRNYEGWNPAKFVGRSWYVCGTWRWVHEDELSVIGPRIDPPEASTDTANSSERTPQELAEAFIDRLMPSGMPAAPSQTICGVPVVETDDLPPSAGDWYFGSM